MKLDILTIVAHPDDAELSCGGTLAKHSSLGFKTGIIDLTQGEMGTRGTVEERMAEADAASKIMGLSMRENLKFADTRFENDEKHRLEVIKKIREYQPEIIITNAPSDRHPDHGRAAELVKQAAWLAGLVKYETEANGAKQKAWRPKYVYHAIQFNFLEPDFVVDITNFVEIKMQAILAYKSQFYDPNASEPNTLISRPEFLEMLRSRNISHGNFGMVDYAEGFISMYKPAVKSLFDLV